MIAFRIKVNGKRVATAGLPGHHVLSAILTSVHRDTSVEAGWRSEDFPERELRFDVGGLDVPRREHLDWFSRRLQAGDRIELEILDTDEVDRPVRRRGPRRSKRATKAAATPQSGTRRATRKTTPGVTKKAHRRPAKK